MTKIQSTKRFLPPEHPDFINFHKNPPLKKIFQNPPLEIRGVRGVMKIMEITPFIPLTLRGRFKGSSGEVYPRLVGGDKPRPYGLQEIPPKVPGKRGILPFPATNIMTKVIGHPDYEKQGKVRQ